MAGGRRRGACRGGWIARGREANSYYGEVGDAEKADLKETFTLGREDPGGDPAWFMANVWPAEVPGLREPVSAYADQVQDLYRELLEGYGGLQVQTLDGEWADAPYVPGAFTVNIADLLARWTGDRRRSTRHRVLPPSDADPNEELISLIVFCESDMDRVITPLAPPVGGGTSYPPVLAGDYYREREAAASVG